jgi:hypothetical protein
MPTWIPLLQCGWQIHRRNVCFLEVVCDHAAETSIFDEGGRDAGVDDGARVRSHFVEYVFSEGEA